MSGPPRQLHSPHAAFAALSARGSLISGLSSGIDEIEKLIAIGDDIGVTEAFDRRCRALEGMGLQEPKKVSLDLVPSYSNDDNVYKWIDKLFLPILQVTGGASLKQWIHEENFWVWNLQPPAEILTARDADYYTPGRHGGES